MGAAVLAVAMASVVSVPSARASAVPVGQPLVILLHAKVARSKPSVHSRRLTSVASRRPLTGAETVLPVFGHSVRSGGLTWKRVRLPGRPNSSTGWITTAGTMPSWTPWRLRVNLHARRVTVYYRGRVRKRFPAVVGKPSTPTPTGQFFIEEDVALRSQAAGAPYALASSARSDVLRHFDGGPGQVAIHGVSHLVGALGTATSHGCIRVDAADVTWLAHHIGSGTPLTITAGSPHV